MAAILTLLCAGFVHSVLAKGSVARVECSPEMMEVIVPMDGDRQRTYLDQLKDYKPCKPELQDGMAMYKLDLQDHYKCGVTRVLHKVTGKRTFYHKVVIEDSNGDREVLSVRCVVVPQKLQDIRLLEVKETHAVSRRAVVDPLPIDFHEPEVVEITREMEERAPEPQLSVAVKQNGKQVSGEISVSPGTPLSMEISLDNSSAPVYGLLVSYMHVTDTGRQQETIVFNGCSVDPYLFDNFLTEDGDVLKAKFRAFKFPDTTYVQFRGTVMVCLDKCQGVACSNGVTGYGRRKREVASGADANRVYEVSLTTIIKVDWTDKDREPEDVLALLKNLKIANQMLEDKDGTPATVAERTQDNKLQFVTATNNSSVLQVNYLVFLIFILFK